MKGTIDRMRLRDIEADCLFSYPLESAPFGNFFGLRHTIYF